MSGRSELPSGLVTFVFTDIEGSTRLARMLSDDYGMVLNDHRSVMRAALRDFGGVELFTEGDSFFIVFRDAVAAVAACVEAQRRLSAHDWLRPEVAPRVRMGMHTGWARPTSAERGGEYASIEVHRAARVSAAAHGGQILCSGATARAVRLTSEISVTTVQSSPAMAMAAALRAADLNSESDLGIRKGPARAGQGRDGREWAAREEREWAARSGQEWPAQGDRPRPRPSEPAPATRRLADYLDGVGLLDLGEHRLRGFDDSDRLLQVLAPGLESDFPRPRTQAAPVHNLPAELSPFVGRPAEKSEVAVLIGRHRIVTITGAGGMGKTRLSLAVAEQVLPAYPQGVWTVDADGGPVEAMAAVLGVRSEPGRLLLDSLIEHCAERRMLLVLQTSEAATAACATLIRRLLARCPGVNVLVTGRAPVGMPGEVVWRIPPMSPADVFALLSVRTAAARGGQAGPGEDGVDLAEVAARMEGSPLMIELAAARLRLLSATQLASRLDDPLAALDPPGNKGSDPPGHKGHKGGDRHDSLRANLDWSYERLTGEARGLLRRLAVFADSVDLGIVEWCGAEALGSLGELTDNSLVDVVPGPRYRLSGQVKSYAARRLVAEGDEREARDRHAAWSLHMLDSVAVDTDGEPRTVSLTAFAPYVAEWQAALRWSAVHGSVREGLRLAIALDPWWREHGGAGEGRDLLFRLYRRLDGADVEPSVLADAYLVHAGLAGDRVERTRFLDRAEALAQDDKALAVRVMAGHRATMLDAGRYDDAERLCREVIATADRYGVAEAAMPAVIALAELLWRRDAVDEAAELLGGARQWEASRPEDRGRRTVDWLLGMVALRRRDLVAAHDHLVVALRSRLRHGFRGAAADAVAAIAVRCALGGDPASAAVLFGGAEAAKGARRTEMFGRFWSAQQLALRSALGDAAFDVAYADGVGLGFDRIVAMALAVEHPDLEDGATRFAQVSA
ncbi:adenylate/guanylate cyclase domain-containing protein [Actinoplanes sp. NPDC049596]|uniref:adenylate/guanylate cyclase domain-containing protein n=1 Tax=unclassified Actinoplanes TaxID=2626549 RepID=UPI003443C213